MNRSYVLASMSPTLPHAFSRGEPDTLPAPVASIPFAGRLGANQQFSLDKNNCSDKELLKKHPDAAPLVPFKDSLSLKQFLEIGLWKAAAVEGIGTPAVMEQNATKRKFDAHLIRDLFTGIPNYPLSSGAGGKHKVSIPSFLTMHACVNGVVK